MIIDHQVVVTILAFFGIGVLAIVQFLKNLLKLKGTGAMILAGVVSVVATGSYLLYSSQFTVLALIVYSFIVFGEATGLYQFVSAQVKKITK